MNEDKLWNGKFILIFITNLLMYGVFYALNPVLPIYATELGLGAQIGTILVTMSITTILFRPIAGYLLDNFNRYRVYLIFLAFLCLCFVGYAIAKTFEALIVVRLFTGAFWSICGSATVTLAGDTLPRKLIGMGINRFTLTIALGMAVGPFIGIQIQNNVSSEMSFYVMFGMIIIGLVCCLLMRQKYPKIERKPFSWGGVFYGKSVPFMINMAFVMVPYGAFLAYSTQFAASRGLIQSVALFYVFMSLGLIICKFVTQRIVDRELFGPVVVISLVILAVAMVVFQFITQGWQLWIVGFILGLGYGVLQPLFQSLISNITPPPKRGVANATYLLSYDIGIGAGAFLLGQFPVPQIGFGYALTAIGYALAAVMFFAYTYGYYRKQKAAMPAFPPGGGPGGPGGPPQSAPGGPPNSSGVPSGPSSGSAS
jgi:MFS family permease